VVRTAEGRIRAPARGVSAPHPAAIFFEKKTVSAAAVRRRGPHFSGRRCDGCRRTKTRPNPAAPAHRASQHF